MTVNEIRKRLLRQLNSHYIYGKYVWPLCTQHRRAVGRRALTDLFPQPLLHAIIALLQITMVSILIRQFTHHYTNRPVSTTMITNAVRFRPSTPPRPLR